MMKKSALLTVAAMSGLLLGGVTSSVSAAETSSATSKASALPTLLTQLRPSIQLIQPIQKILVVALVPVMLDHYRWIMFLT